MLAVSTAETRADVTDQQRLRERVAEERREPRQPVGLPLRAIRAVDDRLDVTALEGQVDVSRRVPEHRVRLHELMLLEQVVTAFLEPRCHHGHGWLKLDDERALTA